MGTGRCERQRAGENGRTWIDEEEKQVKRTLTWLYKRRTAKVHSEDVSVQVCRDRLWWVDVLLQIDAGPREFVHASSLRPVPLALQVGRPEE